MHNFSFAPPVTEQCELCDEGTATLTSREITFPYGEGQERAVLHARVPTWSCNQCGGSYSAEGTEEAQHDAVCDHLGRLRPSEIRAIRTKLGMNQMQFGDHTGIGSASIKRWESGSQIQTKAFDNLMRFYQQGFSLTPRAQNRFRNPPVWRTHIGRDRIEAAAAFELAA